MNKSIALFSGVSVFALSVSVFLYWLWFGSDSQAERAKAESKIEPEASAEGPLSELQVPKESLSGEEGTVETGGAGTEKGATSSVAVSSGATGGDETARHGAEEFATDGTSLPGQPVPNPISGEAPLDDGQASDEGLGVSQSADSGVVGESVPPVWAGNAETSGGPKLVFDKEANRYVLGDVLTDLKPSEETPDSSQVKSPVPDTVTRARLASAPRTTRSFRSGSRTIFRCKEGTELTVGPNVFEYADGRPLETDATVVLEVLEFYDFYDVLMAGLTTHGPDGLLETGGMLYLSATASQQPLRIMQGKGVGVKFASDSKAATEGMELYHGVERESAVKWIKAALPKPTATGSAKGALEPLPRSIVLLDGSLEGENLSAVNRVRRNRKLDHGKLREGGETLEGTAHVWGAIEGKAIGGKVVFSNGVRLYPFPSVRTQRFGRTVVDAMAPRPIAIESFLQNNPSTKPEEWFAMENQRAGSSLTFKHRLRSGGFVCKTPVLRNDSIVRTRFPWGEVEVPRGRQGTFFVKHLTESGGGFATTVGCLAGTVQVKGQLGVGRKSIPLSKGKAITLVRQGTPDYAPPKKSGGLNSKYNPWEFGFRQYPKSSELLELDKSASYGDLTAIRGEVERDSSINEYYRSIQEEDMRRIERQFTVVRMGWHNLDKPGLRDTAAKVDVDFSDSSESYGDATPLVRAVYRGQASCSLVDGKSWIPSGEALLVGVAYNPQTLRPSLDFREVSIRPGGNSFALAPGNKTSDDLRKTLAVWRGTE